jgi:hypothetical protein
VKHRGGRPGQQFALLIERLPWIALADDTGEWLGWKDRWRRLHANRKALLGAARQLRRRKISCPLIGAEIGRWERAAAAMHAEIWDGFSSTVEAKKSSVLARLDLALVEGEIEMLANIVFGPEIADPLNRLASPMARLAFGAAAGEADGTKLHGQPRGGPWLAYWRGSIRWRRLRSRWAGSPGSRRCRRG